MLGPSPRMGDKHLSYVPKGTCFGEFHVKLLKHGQNLKNWKSDVIAEQFVARQEHLQMQCRPCQRVRDEARIAPIGSVGGQLAMDQDGAA
jgi:hypothetical protein